MHSGQCAESRPRAISLSCAPCARKAAMLVCLHRRTLCRAVAAKDAAVAWQWTNQNMAGLAFAEKQAGVHGHFKLGGMATFGARQSRVRLDFVATGGGSCHLVLSLFDQCSIGRFLSEALEPSMYSRTSSRARCKRLLTAPGCSPRRLEISAMVSSSKSRSSTTSR